MRKISMLYLLLAGIFLLAGCSDETASIQKEEETDYARVTLFSDVEFWHPPAWDVSEGTITGEISRKTKAVVDVKNIIGDPDKQLSLMIVNNELPDIISVTNSTVINQLVTSGKVWKIDEFLEEYKPDSHLLDNMPEDIRQELVQRDGAWYVLPSHVNSPDARSLWKASDKRYDELAQYGDNLAIIWNKELLEKLGLAVENLQTEEQVLAAFKRAGQQPDVIPLLVDGDSWQESTLAFLANTFGVEVVDEEGNYIDPALQAEMKDALYFFHTVMQRGYADINQMSMSNDEVKGVIAGGNVLCFIGNVANTAIDEREWVSSGAIRSATGKTSVAGRSDHATTGWINTFIAKDCKNPEQIADFIDYMTSDEGLLLWGYGEEGKHYNRDEDGLIELTEEGLNARVNYTQSGVAAWWMFANTAWDRSVLAPFEEGSVDEASYEITTAYALDEDTHIYDSALVSNLSETLLPGSIYEKMEENVEEWKRTQFPRVILAENDRLFEQEYQNLLSGLAERQIYELDSKKNDSYQKNCSEYGKKIEKMN